MNENSVIEKQTEDHHQDENKGSECLGRVHSLLGSGCFDQIQGLESNGRIFCRDFIFTQRVPETNSDIGNCVFNIFL